MKAFKIIFAALAATAALVSCTKEITPPNFENDKVAPASEGSRVIAVSFGPQTKTRLDGLQPKFNDGDSIFLCTKADKQEDIVTDIRRVTVDDYGNATITTELTGELVAWYPARAVTYDDYTGGYNILNTPVQTGKFADANICSAGISGTAKKATFKNEYALLIVTPPDGAQSLTIKSLKVIEESSGQRTGKSAAINVSTVTDSAYFVTVPTPPAEDGKYYVALRENLFLSNLSFEVKFEEEGTGSIKGIPLSRIEKNAAALGEASNKYNFIDRGTAYTIDDKNWHEYVEVGGHKWATMNVGAENSTDAGKYFAWGDTEGQIAKTEGQGAFDTPFDWAHAPFTDDGDCSSEASIAQVAAACPGNVLALQYDAANANWGGAWRMPTTDEYFSLAIACGWDPEDLPVLPAVTASLDKGCYKLDKAQEILPEYSGFVGLLTIEDSEHKLFFPAAGEGSYNGTLELRNEYGFYYSSTYFSSSTAYTWVFTVTLYTNNTSSSRCDGYTVRAIIDESDADTPSGGDEEESASPTDMEEDVLL